MAGWKKGISKSFVCLSDSHQKAEPIVLRVVTALLVGRSFNVGVCASAIQLCSSSPPTLLTPLLLLYCSEASHCSFQKGTDLILLPCHVGVCSIGPGSAVRLTPVLSLRYHTSTARVPPYASSRDHTRTLEPITATAKRV